MLTSQQNLTAAKQTVMSKCPHSERKTQLIKSAPMDLLTSRQLDDFQENAAVFAQVNAWVKNYLARPHKDLGRPGTVCPFAPEALMRDSIRVAVVRLTRHAESEIEAAVDHFRQVFHVGVEYTLPMLVIADVSIDSEGKLRFQLSREDVAISKRLRFNFMVNTDKEYTAGFRYITTKWLALSTHFDSDMGLGAGVVLTY